MPQSYSPTAACEEQAVSVAVRHRTVSMADQQQLGERMLPGETP
jgi:hypothetical protein